MKKEIQESITFLMSEFKRLKKKQEKEELTEEEKDTLDKLYSFLGEGKEWKNFIIALFQLFYS